MKKNILNKFFNQIYVINLDGKEDRYKKVDVQFKRRGIKIDRFEAIDGRCKTKKECLKKKKEFEKKYDVTISSRALKDGDINMPSNSVFIGTILILKEMIKKKWDNVLICEDDIVLGKSLSKKFEEGVKELKKSKPDWDVLYLGCGGLCGYRGMSLSKTKTNKFIADPYKYEWVDEKYYVANKDDLRSFCDESNCKKLSKNLTNASNPGGGWCYAFSRKGAKKFLKNIEKKNKTKTVHRINHHMDQILPRQIRDGKIKAVAFDPPIVWHEEGAARPDTDIPW